MDFKAARPFGGFLDVTSHHTCFLCKCWHLSHIGRTDFENWRPADITFLQKGTQAWLTAPTIAQRKQVENFFGTRSSELWRLPYWKPTLQLLIEPMHTLFLILEQRYARHALGLDNPEPDGVALDEPEQGNPKRKKARLQKKKMAYISFYHEFTPPPHPSDLTPLGMGTETGRLSDALRELFDEPEVQDQRLSLLEWNDLTPEQNSARLSRNEQFVSTIQGDPRAFQAVYDLYQSLSSPAPVKEAEKQKFLKKLSSYRWIVLAFVCNNLVEFPTPKQDSEGKNEKKASDLLSRSSLHKGDVTVKMFAQALSHWVCQFLNFGADLHSTINTQRLHKVEPDRFKWPHFIPKDKQLPSIPWLHLHGMSEDQQRFNKVHQFTLQDRFELLAELTKQLNLHSAHAIGAIHRFLTQPIEKDTAQLESNIGKLPFTALAFVCIDLDCLPVGKFGKSDLVQHLVEWVRP